MKREVNMRPIPKENKRTAPKNHVMKKLDVEINGRINTDPLGMWTGVPLDDPFEEPVQDADDL